MDINAWKERIRASSSGLDAFVKDMPMEVAEALARDPEVGARVTEALRKVAPVQRPAPPATPPQPLAPAMPVGGETSEAANGPEAALDAEDAGPSEDIDDVSPAAVKARMEREGRAEKEDQKKLSLMAQIQRLDVGAKSKLARMGDKDVRSILIRESNKQISTAVIENPRMTVQEIETISASRNVSEDILRMISANKDWTKSYAVVLNLVNNPKTPVGISLTFLPRLLTRDVRTLAKSKGVPEVLKITAKKLAQKRAV